MNKISVIGRVSTDVGIKEFNGRNVANFNVASNTKRKVGEENGRPKYGVNFYRVSAWGQEANTASKFLRKGYRVGVSGDLEIRDYTGNDGLKHTVVEINNADIDLIETKAESEAKIMAASGVTSVNTAAPATPAPQTFTPVETDELPF